MKYHNKKVYCDGMTFDSKKEAQRYHELLMLQQSGHIQSLKRQVPFELIPEQREPETVDNRGRNKRGRLLERKVMYFADFAYFDNDLMEYVVEDVKGFKTPEYKLKRKLMLYMHNIRIKET